MRFLHAGHRAAPHEPARSYSRPSLRCLVFGTIAAGMLAGCSPIVAQRGNIVDDVRLSQLRVGQMNRVEVLNTLGTPTSKATFDDNTWYYIGQITKQTAFFQPDVTERKIVKVEFDDDGVLKNVEEIGLDKAQDVEMVERTTPTRGKELGFLEQMLGNLGRFNAPSTK